jgi:hypothetical protein
MKKKFTRLFIFFSLCALFQTYKGICQASITGPTCVISGMEYQYLITGNWDDYSTMQLCVQHGRIVDNDSACLNGPPVAFVHVIWDKDTSGGISLISSDGNYTVSIEQTTVLEGGRVDSVSIIQTVTPRFNTPKNNLSRSYGGQLCAILWIPMATII